MKSENLIIEVDGDEIDDLYPDLRSIEVELDDQLAGMFRLGLVLRLGADGSWSALDDDRLRIWRKVQISAKVGGETVSLITGYVTHVRPEFGIDATTGFLELWGLDASVLMDRADRLKDWPNKKDSDIAGEIFQTYGLTARVTDTGVIHDEESSTIIQRETDAQLLRRLALRNGYECYVDGDTGYFGPPALTGPRQPVLAVIFGADTNVTRFRLEIDALAPADVAMYQVDHRTGEVLDVRADQPQQPALGAKHPGDFLGSVAPGRVVVAQTVATGEPELRALTRGLYDQGEWFVTGEGEVAGDKYGGVLKPRATVTMKGLGETHSGTYYVTHVTHQFSANGYNQRFRVKRNALLPTGSESWSDDGGALGALAGLL